MTGFARKTLTLALLVSAAMMAQSSNRSFAAGTDTPTPPPPSETKAPPASGTKSAPADKKSSIEGPAFLKGYRAAYASIYERGEYKLAITQLESLGQNDRADVANLIGYSHRKLGNTQLASAWYERALKADPAHVRTWQYYGLWQVEQGNREQALYHLGKIEQIAGRNNEEYRSLAAALTTGRTGY